MTIEISPLEQSLKKLDNVIAEVESAKLRETVLLLKIARLDLVLRASGYSDAEFDAALVALRQDASPAKSNQPVRCKKNARGPSRTAGHC